MGTHNFCCYKKASKLGITTERLDHKTDDNDKLVDEISSSTNLHSEWPGECVLVNAHVWFTRVCCNKWHIN
jgi:hypothetical protein